MSSADMSGYLIYAPRHSALSQNFGAIEVSLETSTVLTSCVMAIRGTILNRYDAILTTEMLWNTKTPRCM